MRVLKRIRRIDRLGIVVCQITLFPLSYLLVCVTAQHQGNIFDHVVDNTSLSYYTGFSLLFLLIFGSVPELECRVERKLMHVQLSGQRPQYRWFFLRVVNTAILIFVGIILTEVFLYLAFRELLSIEYGAWQGYVHPVIDQTRKFIMFSVFFIGTYGLYPIIYSQEIPSKFLDDEIHRLGIEMPVEFSPLKSDDEENQSTEETSEIIVEPGFDPSVGDNTSLR